MRKLSLTNLFLLLSVVAVTPAFAAGPGNAAEVAAFLEPVAADWQAAGIPGAVFVLVKDGRVLFSRGYGFADVEAKRPVDPERTVFRTGAGFPVLVALGLLQLQEEGRFDFRADVNRYLKRFRVEDTFPEPVTGHHLMTHTGGFDETFIGINARREEEKPPLGEYLAANMPARIKPPGGIRSHSPFGYALAGHLVEAVSGMSFPEYAEERIFQPLGMARSSFVTRPGMKADLAASYQFVPGNPVRAPVDYSIIEPELNTTAADMARLLLAMLGQGEPGGARLLRKRESFDLLHRRQFTHHPQLPGPTYGQFESFYNGRVGSTNSGSRSGHTSQVFFLREEGLGFFIAFTGSRYLLLEDFDQRFMDHFYPAAVAPPRAGPVDAARAAEYAGIYRHSRYPRGTVDRLPSLATGYVREIEVGHDGKGGVTVLGAPYVEIEPGVIQRNGPGPFIVAAATDKAVFHRDGRGRVTHMFVGSAAFEKLAWYETSTFHLYLFSALFLLFLSACLLWPLGALVARMARRDRPAVAPRARNVRILAWVLSALCAAFLAGLVAVLGLRGPDRLAYEVPAALKGLLVLPLATTLLTAVLLRFLVPAWRDRYWGLGGRFWYTLVVAAAVALIPFLIYWRLLGFAF
jgi:CubicO group peptidase (beta-lactamase class C family)